MSEVRSMSSKMLVKAAQDLGLTVKVVAGSKNFIEVSSDTQSMYIQATAFSVNNQVATRIANNKYLTKKVLRQHGVPTLRSWLITKKSEAKKIIAKHQPFPFVLKPAQGAHGNDVYVNIESEEEAFPLLDKIFKGKTDEGYLLEQYFVGHDLRVFVVGKEGVAVLERIPANVTGDGQHTVRQLVQKFNQHPLVGEGYEKPMCKIRLNGEAKRTLEKQGFTLKSIPEKDQQVFVRQNANISTGGIGRDATDSIPEKVKQLAVDACQAIGLEIAGVDILFNDQSGEAVILEINDCPGIDVHHFPVIGKPRNVAKSIMSYLFQESLAGSVATTHDHHFSWREHFPFLPLLS